MKIFRSIILAGFVIGLLVSCQDKKEKKTHQKDKLTADVGALSKQAPEPVIRYGYNLDDYTIQRDTVHSGDSFGKIMLQNGLNSKAVFDINQKVVDTFNTARIRAGRPYLLVRSKGDSSKIDAFIYLNDKINYTVIDLKDSIRAYRKSRPVTLKKRAITGIINSSLSQAMDAAGAPLDLINEIAGIYQWKIDFFRLQKGDKFKVLYEERYIEDSIYAGVKKVQAAEFIHYGEPYYAFRYGEDKSGNVKFYDEEAKTLQNMFLKAPVKYTRISSRYSPRRFHPIQKRWKAHLGTDYAAPTGTPIHSTADGVVIASRYTRFNGNYVKIRHNSKYTTQYLHMSRRKARVGQHVKQGDVIGYVGMTGLATGPHVCYRFWVNGKQVDPYKQKMPSSEPLPDSLKTEYFKYIGPLKEKLERMEVQESPKKDENLALVPSDKDSDS